MKAPPQWFPSEYGMYLDCEYKEGLVNELKNDVPYQERRWDGKRWWISDAYLDEVDALLFKYFERTGIGR